LNELGSPAPSHSANSSQPARDTGSFPDTGLRIVSAAAAYLIVAAATRLAISVWPGISLGGFIYLTGDAVFDFLLIAGTSVLFLSLAYLWRKRPVVLRRLHRAFLAIGFFLVILGCINAQAILLIGGPLTYQWLSYADLSSFTSQASLAAAINAQFVLITVLASLGYFALYFGLLRLCAAARMRGFLPPLLGAATVLAAAFVIFAFARSEGVPHYAANPLVEIVATAIRGDTSNLLRDRDSIAPEELPPPTHSQAMLPDAMAGGRKNIVLIVLESVGANHVPGTGSPEAYAWMPNVARYRDRTLAFPNFYTHAAHSTKALFSLLTGRAPTFTFDPETYAYQQASFVTLSGRLKQLGYRTAFFMSGDFAFQSVDRFLANRGFDQLSDKETIGCTGAVYQGSTITWPNLDSIDDQCTARALVKWIAQPADQPFFAIFWTGNTHWPYFSQEAPRPGQFSQDPVHNRYLAALRATDLAVGYLLDELSRREMLDDTIVMIVGDHGQAFKEHGYSIHGSTLYEEEVRIPLLMIGSGLDGSNQALGGLSDIPPTVLHIVGTGPEPSWSGRSLFEPRRPRRVMFFVANSAMAVGFREENRKYIYNLTRGRPYVFNLTGDPGESRNIADEGSADYIRRHASGWMQEQERRLRSLRR
jgi:arylsulfatase A-like enzyme